MSKKNLQSGKKTRTDATSLQEFVTVVIPLDRASKSRPRLGRPKRVASKKK